MKMEQWKVNLIGKKSEEQLVASADCPKCLSKNTVFHKFDGERVDDNKGMMNYMIIRGEVHVCRSCWNEFTKRDGPWIGLTLGDWHNAVRHGLSFDRVLHYTAWVRGNIVPVRRSFG
jgi:hypothetical protein